MVNIVTETQPLPPVLNILNSEMDQGWSEKYLQERILKMNSQKIDMFLKEAEDHWKQMLQYVHPKFLLLLHIDWAQSWIEHNSC